MPRNTFVLISLLAVFAALVIGVNIGKRFNNPSTVVVSPPTITITPPAGEPTLLPQTITYASPACGVSFDYPANFAKQEAFASTSAIFTDSQNANAMIIFTCQKDIPKPPLPPDKIETMKVGSISATLYHDANAKDGKPIDKLIFRHPKTGLDIFLAGIGSTFQQTLASIKILP